MLVGVIVIVKYNFMDTKYLKLLCTIHTAVHILHFRLPSSTSTLHRPIY